MLRKFSDYIETMNSIKIVKSVTIKSGMALYPLKTFLEKTLMLF